MYDILPREKANNKVALLFKANENTNVAIKTPFGLTERMKKKEVVQQGGSWWGILCSNMVDKQQKNLVMKQKLILINTIMFCQYLIFLTSMII